MLKKDIIKKLKAQGKSEEDLKGLSKAELEDLLVPEVEIFQIVSKRESEYWLSNGDTLSFKEVGIPIGGLAPAYKAGDSIKKEKGKWVLA